MIQEEVNMFMALATLMAPSLFSTPSENDSEITDDYALLTFPLEEKLPIGIVIDMCNDNLELLQLFFAKKMATQGVQHCCLFSRPSASRMMFKINLTSDSVGYVCDLTVTIFGETEVFEQALEDDLTAHASSFYFEDAMSAGDVLSLFCKL